MLLGQTQVVIPANQAQQRGENQSNVKEQRHLPKYIDEQLEEFEKIFPKIDKM